MRDWIWRIGATLRRKRLVEDKVEEMQTHLDLEIESGLRQGLAKPEAIRRARLRAGLISEGIESTREEFGLRWLDGLAADFRHAFRALIRDRGFGIVAVLVLAISVAINTLIFCMLDGVVLRPLPYRSPERLVRLYDAGSATPKFPMSLGRFLDYRAQAHSLESIALYTGRDMELTATEGQSKRLIGISITSDYFATLGKTPALGRPFNDTDLRDDVHNAILSDRLWRDRFHADPSIVGKLIRLDRQPWTIVGVAAPGFQHVGGDYRSPLQGETVDIWTPLALNMADVPLRAYHYCNAIARIRSGFTEAQSRQELAGLAESYNQRFPKFGQWTVSMEPLLSEVTGRSSQVVWLLVAAGGLVLLVACANIAGLCLARAVSRRKELALRHALGANRWQLIRVGLTENLVIGAAGASLGLLLTRAGMPVLQQLLPADFPRAHEVALTLPGALFAVATSLGTVLLAGLLPMGRRQAPDARQRITAGRDSRKLRSLLVTGEIALAGLLCAGSLFLLRSYRQIEARDHGFKPSGVLTFQLSVPGNGGRRDPAALPRLYESIRSNIAAIPGVASVGATTNLPWSGYDENTGFGIVGRAADKDDSPGARYQAASAGYFEAAGMRLLHGRLFEHGRDGFGQPPAVIVNDALAARYFPRGDAVGAVLDLGTKRQIIGVVAGIQDHPADLDVKPAFWFPLEQVGFSTVLFAVRSVNVPPASLGAAMTSAVHAADPELALADIRTLDDRAAGALASRRFALWLFQSFAALALVLASTGVYGLLAYFVQQRRKELGIRMALGATRGDLWTMVLSDGLKMASLGALACLLLIPLAGTLLRVFLYRVQAFDLFTVAVAPAALLTVAVLASLGPARSAAKSDPAVSLRED